MENQPPTNDRKKIIIIIVLSVLLVGFIVLLFAQARRNSGDGAESVEQDSAAFMSYKDEPYLPLSTNAANGYLNADVAYFARNAIPGYGPKDNPNVLFALNKAPVTSGTSIAFVGTFERSKDPINVSVTPLKNNHLKTSITDTVTGKNIDAQLPSNSTRNQFIGTLPVGTAAYSIDYLSSNDSIQITLYDYNAQATAESALMAGLKVTSLSGVPYSILKPTSGGEGAPAY